MHPIGVSADAGDVGPEGPFRPGVARLLYAAECVGAAPDSSASSEVRMIPGIIPSWRPRYATRSAQTWTD